MLKPLLRIYQTQKIFQGLEIEHIVFGPLKNLSLFVPFIAYQQFHRRYLCKPASMVLLAA
jgi:hypothetical protein